MSRVGRKPIPIPQGVKVDIRDEVFTAEGPKGRVEQKLFRNFPVEVKDGVIQVGRPGETGPERARHGLLRALLSNAVEGAAKGWSRQLEIVGVGYKAELKGKELHFALGYSHPIVFPVPPGIKVEVDTKAGRVNVEGADRQMVGQVAAVIRSLREPDPYKGKGVRYAGEVLRRKVGKAGAR